MLPPRHRGLLWCGFYTLTMEQQAPPGWYPDGPHLRWWTGTEWGAFAPPSRPLESPEESGKAMAIVSHLGLFLGVGFLLPLIVYLVVKDQNRFSRHHSSEALNFQLTLMFVYFPSSIAMFGIFFFIDSGGVFAAVMIVLMIFWVVVAMASVVFAIIGVVNASQGEYWRYPLTVRMVDRGN